MRIAFERGSIEIHVKPSWVPHGRLSRSVATSYIAMRFSRIAMSDGRFVSVAIAIAGEGELPTVNWQIVVCMSDERLLATETQ